MSLLALAGCGFSPVYGPSGVASKLRGAIEVQTPPTIAGYRLGTALIEQFGPVKTVAYTLSVSLSESQSAAAQTIDGDTTRFDLTGRASWTLTDVLGMDIATGQAETFTSYSGTGSTLATQTAERDARERLSMALADIIVADVILSVP